MQDPATVETPLQEFRWISAGLPGGGDSVSGRNLDEEPKPDRTKRQFAIQICTLIARASQAAYWVYKLWELN
jgi:hypothetical protein